MIEIIEFSVNSKDAGKLILELNQSLIEITGDDVTSSFDAGHQFSLMDTIRTKLRFGAANATGVCSMTRSSMP